MNNALCDVHTSNLILYSQCESFSENIYTMRLSYTKIISSSLYFRLNKKEPLHILNGAAGILVVYFWKAEYMYYILYLLCSVGDLLFLLKLAICLKNVWMATRLQSCNAAFGEWTQNLPTSNFVSVLWPRPPSCKLLQINVLSLN